MTYVPGFWSWKGLNSTVLTLMVTIESMNVETRGRDTTGGEDVGREETREAG
jgi:hypothetical protein